MTEKKFSGFFGFEHRRRAVASRRRFAARMGFVLSIWLSVTVTWLLIGIAGYAFFESMGLADAFANAAMILSGMGPFGELTTTGGKLFAGCYAIFSGLIIVVATGLVLAPIFHRVLHRFHVEQEGDR
jgi:NhaP-type Na+/H+ or K+/H+ antiporter